MAHLLVADALLLHLGLHRRDNRAEIGVAAALAETVDGALYLDDALFDRDHGVGYRTFAIVMGVNAERGLDMLLNRLDDFGDLERHRSAVGVTQYDAVHVCIFRGLESLDRVIGIGLVAVKEMLRIIENFRSMFFQILQ